MSDTLPSVALLIVAYGHAESLRLTLHALQALEYPRAAHSMLVVDNGDGRSAAVARTFPDVQVIEPGRNLGFAGGCNLAAAHTDADMLVLINPDLEPQPSFLHAIVEPLNDPQVGVVGAKLIYPDSHTIQHAGGYLTQPLALAQHVGYSEPDRGQYDSPRDVQFVTGAALAIRHETWNALGGMDESFFPAYFEDVDLCLCVRKRGLIVRYDPRAVAIHHESVGVGKGSVEYHRLYHTNRLQLLFKHRPDEWLVHMWLPAELAHLRATADDAEITGLLEAYRCWQARFLGVEAATPEVTKAPAADADHTPGATHDLPELDWTIQQVAAKRTIVPLPFRSRWPLVARLRTWFNRIATESYVRPLIQQQNDYNAAMAELGQALARQRRTTDAAILCQGVLLAKLLTAGNLRAEDEAAQ